MAGTQKIKIINILLSSVDGKIATRESESTHHRRVLKFGNSDDFKHLQKITAQCDAVFIGAKSIESEKGAFRVAHLRKDHKEPYWYVFTKSGEINKSHPFWQQKNIQKKIFEYQSVNELKKFIHSLSKLKIKKIALLGGGKLNGLFWSENMVDELYLTISPFVVGDENAPQLVSFQNSIVTPLELLKAKKIKNFLFLHYKVIK